MKQGHLARSRRAARRDPHSVVAGAASGETWSVLAYERTQDHHVHHMHGLLANQLWYTVSCMVMVRVAGAAGSVLGSGDHESERTESTKQLAVSLISYLDHIYQMKHTERAFVQF